MGDYCRHFAVEPQSDGSYFIDRSSKWFSVILDYLRTRSLSVDIYDMGGSDRVALQKELEFYGFASLLDLFQGILLVFYIVLFQILLFCQHFYFILFLNINMIVFTFFCVCSQVKVVVFH